MIFVFPLPPSPFTIWQQLLKGDCWTPEARYFERDGSLMYCDSFILLMWRRFLKFLCVFYKILLWSLKDALLILRIKVKWGEPLSPDINVPLLAVAAVNIH